MNFKKGDMVISDFGHSLVQKRNWPLASQYYLKVGIVVSNGIKIGNYKILFKDGNSLEFHDMFLKLYKPKPKPEYLS